jgi:hypothetical protein
VNTLGYDIIGDVHGCAFTLIKLLEKLGYQDINGVYQHPNRQAIFVGDLIDRGPHIREAVAVVKNMVDAGVADCVMGNHEYNALGYHLWLPQYRRHLREHIPRHQRLIAETLQQYAAHPEEWEAVLGWLQQRPLFIEVEQFRVVHACWDQELIYTYQREYGKNTVDAAFLADSVDTSRFAGLFMDRLTRGTDMPLPPGVEVLGRDGYSRDHFRTKFWAQNPQTYQDVVFQPDPLPDHLVDTPLSASEQARLLRYGLDQRPVFVGHYWLTGTPAPLMPNIACLDYSAVKYGRLVAYRFDGEAVLDAKKFVWVYVDASRDEGPTQAHTEPR